MPRKIETVTAPRQHLEFAIVDPTEVPPSYGRGPGSLSPASLALLEGKTIWVAGESQRANRFHLVAKRRGYRVRTRSGPRDGVRGVYVWLEPLVDVEG